MKRTCYTIHKWCGLTAATLLFVQAITGLALVFHWELARVLDPDGMVRHSRAGEASLEQIDGALRARVTDLAWQRLVFPKSDNGTYLAQFTDAQGSLHYASVDPGDAQVLRAGTIWSFPMEAAVRIHFNLLAGRAGVAVVALLAATLCGLIVTGLIVWWPHKRYFARALRIQWRAPMRRLVHELHRVVGAVAAVFLLGVAATGLLLAVEPLMASGAVPPRLSMTAPAGLMSLDAAFEQAREHFPRHEIYDIRRPNDVTLDVLFRAPEVGPRAVHFVRLDRNTGAATSIMRAGERPNIAFFALPLHTGEQFGVVGQAIEVVCGLVLIVMLITGVLMWIQRRAMKARAAAEAVNAT